MKELRDKYRTYSKQWHPDSYMQNPEKLVEAEENMKLLNTIYEECSVKIRDAEKFDVMSDIDIISFCRAAGIKVTKQKPKPQRDPNNYRGWWYSPDTPISDIVDILRESVKDIDDYNIEITNPYNGDTIVVRMLGGKTNESITFGDVPTSIRELMSYKQLSYRVRNIFKDIILASREYNYYYEGKVYFNLKLQMGKTQKTPYKYKKSKVKKSRIYHDRDYYARELSLKKITFEKVPPRFRDIRMVELAVFLSDENLKEVLNPKLRAYELLDDDILIRMAAAYPMRTKGATAVLEECAKNNKLILSFDVDKTILNMWRAAVSNKFNVCEHAPEVIKQEQNYYEFKTRETLRSIIMCSLDIYARESDSKYNKAVAKLSKLLMLYDVEMKDILVQVVGNIGDTEKFKNIPKDIKDSKPNVFIFILWLSVTALNVTAGNRTSNKKWNHEEGKWEDVKN
jgi:hypothetical protein